MLLVIFESEELHARTVQEIAQRVVYALQRQAVDDRGVKLASNTQHDGLALSICRHGRICVLADRLEDMLVEETDVSSLHIS